MERVGAAVAMIDKFLAVEKEQERDQGGERGDQEGVQAKLFSLRTW